MDDIYEQPDAIQPKSDDVVDDDAQSSGDEDEGPDWTKYASLISRPSIPKRGEKDYEPKPGGGSGLQVHVLDRARSAMTDALRAERLTSSKNMSYGIWYPDLARVHVTHVRGPHFNNMGHSVPRPGPDGKVLKRLELLPEEAIYLVERGTIFLWKASQMSINTDDGPENMDGPPMSVQQAYAEMIGKEDLTLEKYQVFAYLKRLGYTITRTVPPTEAYPTPPPLVLPSRKTTTASSILQRIRNLFAPAFNWWKPLQFSRFLRYDKTYSHIYHSLRFLPAGHTVPLRSTETEKAKLKSSPYQLFYDLYKPVTPFRKTAPPRSDYAISVVNARDTPMPSIHELTVLYDEMDETPLPPPRQRNRLPGGGPKKLVPNTTALPITDSPAVLATTTPPTTKTTTLDQAQTPTLVHRLFFFLPWFRSSVVETVPVRRINPFVAIRAGKKIAIVAVVDAGNIGFFRFGQGAFEESPMV